MSRFAVVCLVAAAAFIPLFITGGIGVFNFWLWMAANNILLFFLAAWADKSFLSRIASDLKERPLRKIALGLASAFLLYWIFWLGNIVARELFSFAPQGIEAIYGLKEGSSPLAIAALIGLIFGPGEELFWRGFVQQGLSLRFPAFIKPVVLGTLFYAGVHAGSFNPMLVLAALVCGAFWGLLYRVSGSILLVMISHTVWDISVFLLFPYQH